MHLNNKFVFKFEFKFFLFTSFDLINFIKAALQSPKLRALKTKKRTIKKINFLNFKMFFVLKKLKGNFWQQKIILHFEKSG